MSEPHCPTCVCGKRAPVQADMGHHIPDHPDIRRTYPNRKPMGPGTISWTEHEEAWGDYARQYGTQQSAERMAERGGFGYGELLTHLGHEPKTWRPAGRDDLWNKAADS